MSHRVVTVGGKALSLLTACLVGLGLVGWSALAGPDDPIDFEKAQQLRQRMLKGERLGEEERAYLERARPAFQKKQANFLKGAPPTGKDSLGLTPLTDLGGEARYKGQEGGLYGGGKNEPSDALLRAALAMARQVRPLNAEGQPDPDGKVVLLSLGMANTTSEFRTFKRLVEHDGDRSPAVLPVVGTLGDFVSSNWVAPGPVKVETGAFDLDPWILLDSQLRQAGVTARQVQVAWVKEALANPMAHGEFPKHAEALKDNLAVIVRRLKQRFPNLRLIYLSSRSYAGYAGTSQNHEPFAYESAFSVRWLIRDQTGPDKGEVQAPVLLWGPYLWADGLEGRKSDGLVWERVDFAGDWTRPGESGRRKVAELLLKFFKTDPTSRGWFLKTGASGEAP